MEHRLPCEFFLIRYVPDVVKGEYVNIGVLLREVEGGSGKDGARAGNRSAVRFTRDWGRVRCMDADADVGLLEALEQEVAGRLLSEWDGGAGMGKSVVEVLEETLSNSLQMSEGRATLAENMATEMEQLMRMYVEPLKVLKARTAPSGRALISGTMRREFERTGVWGLMRKRIAAAPYTRPGDPLKIDCGYRAGSRDEEMIRMFQAISLGGEMETAKGLAFSAPQLREGVRRVEGARLELTAVVEPLRSLGDADAEKDEDVERYRFAVETMERQEIRVVTLNDLARAAETARRELGL